LFLILEIDDIINIVGNNIKKTTRIVYKKDKSKSPCIGLTDCKELDLSFLNLILVVISDLSYFNQLIEFK